jgi:hypothetical protein
MKDDMSIEEGEEVQAKGMCNIFNRTITENFSNLEKSMPIKIQEASRTPDLTKMKLPYNILSLKQQTQKLEKEY